MDYKKLLFIAPAWRETLNSETGTLVLRPEFSSAGFCETIVTPIPGTDRVRYEYSCIPVTCQGSCELEKHTHPDGTVICYCKCVDESGMGLAKTVGGSSKKKASRRKSK